MEVLQDLKKISSLCYLGSSIIFGIALGFENMSLVVSGLGLVLGGVLLPVSFKLIRG